MLISLRVGWLNEWALLAADMVLSPLSSTRSVLSQRTWTSKNGEPPLPPHQDYLIGPLGFSRDPSCGLQNPQIIEHSWRGEGQSYREILRCPGGSLRPPPGLAARRPCTGQPPRWLNSQEKGTFQDDVDSGVAHKQWQPEIWNRQMTRICWFAILNNWEEGNFPRQWWIIQILCKILSFPLLPPESLRQPWGLKPN